MLINKGFNVVGANVTWERDTACGKIREKGYVHLGGVELLWAKDSVLHV